MRNFAGLLKIFGSPLEKSASPFIRRLVAKHPNMRLTPKLLRMMGNKAIGPQYQKAINARTSPLRQFLGKSGLLDDIRTRLNHGFSDYGIEKEIAAAQEAFDNAASRIGSKKFTIKQFFDSLTPAANSKDPVSSLSQATRELGKAKTKALRAKGKLDATTAAITDATNGSGLTFDDMLQRYPMGRYVYKGGRFNQSAWPMQRGAFFSGRPDVALGYNQAPEASGLTSSLFSVADLEKSKATKTGKTFFTPVVGKVSRKARILGKYDSGHAHINHSLAGWPVVPNYEILLPGNEARSLPVKRFRVVGLPNVELKSGSNFGSAKGVRFIPEDKIPERVRPLFDAKHYIANNALNWDNRVSRIRNYIRKHDPSSIFKKNTYFPRPDETSFLY